MPLKQKPGQPARGDKYRSYCDKSMILRDHLAHDRTVMALERTALAYARTAFLLVTTSVTILKFLMDEPVFVAIGVLLGLAAGVTFAFGLRRYLIFRKKLDSVYKPEKRALSKTNTILMGS